MASFSTITLHEEMVKPRRDARFLYRSGNAAGLALNTRAVLQKE